MKQEPIAGVCPRCAAPGDAGTPCRTAPCAQARVHRIPAAHHVAGGKPDELIGTLAGRFLLVGRIGRGAFGTVYLGMQTPVHARSMRAAVKFLSFGAADGDYGAQLVAKFANEIQALAVLTHPNIIRLVDYEHGQVNPYLVMEYVEGAKSLEDIIEEDRGGGERLPVADKLAIVHQMLDALEAAHTRGIIHRDLKPANVLVQSVPGNRRLVRLVDFGLAKFFEDNPNTAVTIGSPVYMAPEQFERQRLGPWTDLYALGIVTLELMTGIDPFAGTDLKGLMAAKKRDPQVDVDALRAEGCSDRIVSFFQKATAPVIERRYQDVPAFRAALKLVSPDFGDGRTVAGAPALPGKVVDEDDLRETAMLQKPASRPVSRPLPPTPPSPFPPAPPAPPVVAAAPVERRASARTSHRVDRRVAIGIAAAALAAVGAGVGLAVSGGGGGGASDAVSVRANVEVVEPVALTEPVEPVEPEDAAPALEPEDAALAEEAMPDEPRAASAPDDAVLDAATAPSVDATPCRLAGPAGPVAWIRITGPDGAFEIQSREVTWGEWDAWAANAAPRYRPRQPIWLLPHERAGFPVTAMSWEDARAYCQSLGGDLPLDAQWDLATRGDGGGPFVWGDAPFDHQRTRVRSGPGEPWLAVAGSCSQDVSAAGVRDLYGNAQEVMRDLLPGGKDVELRVVRGCRWGDEALCAETRDHRDYLLDDHWRAKSVTSGEFDTIGFRCVREVP